jgi:hypothetical protein
VALVVLIGWLGIDGRRLPDYLDLLAFRREHAADAVAAAEAFAPLVGNGFVTVPAYDIHFWRQGTVVAEPRGLSLTPRGVSDAIVAVRDGPVPGLAGFRDCMALVSETDARALYLRSTDCNDQGDRAVYEDLMGPP